MSPSQIITASPASPTSQTGHTSQIGHPSPTSRTSRAGNASQTASARTSTQALLRYGVLAGPFYVCVSLAQALTREGFDLTRHAWSLLANGSLGWIQIANFLLSGLMVILFAMGLRRALRDGRGRTWAPLLIAGYGLSLIVAGIFRADPALGFPVGTPEGPTPISAHGIVHFMAGGVGFTCLAIACFVVGRRYAAEGRRAWARYSHATGILFLAGFAAVATGGGSPAGTIAFTAAILLVWTWMSTVARDRGRG